MNNNPEERALQEYERRRIAERRARREKVREGGYPFLLTDKLALVRSEVDEVLESLAELTTVLDELQEAAKFLDRDLANAERLWARMARLQQKGHDDAERE